MRLTEIQQDALTEIFNIGAGRAADVLSQMVSEPVSLEVPVVEMSSRRDIRQTYLQTAQSHLCAVSQMYIGELSTDALLMFPEEKSLELVRLMVGGDVPLQQLAEMESDALAEVGNIILNAVVSSLSGELGLSLEGSLPEVQVLDSEALFLNRMGALTPEDALAPVISMAIHFDIKTRKISGFLAFLLDVPSGEILMERLDAFIVGSRG